MKFLAIKKEIRPTLLVYLSTWVFIILTFIILLAIRNESFSEATSIFIELLPDPNFIIAIHILFGLFLVLFWITRYFIRLYKKKGGKVFGGQFAFRFLIPILVIFIGFKTLVFANTNENYSFDWAENVMNTKGKSNDFYSIDKMHRGMSVFGWRGTNDSVALNPLIKANVEWIAVIPFIGQDNETSKTVRRPRDKNSNFTRRDSIFIKTIQNIHAKGLHVQLKPHIWTRSGWRSNITQNTDEEWDTWFDSYESYILHYARIAELTGVELFCIGTELKTSIKNQPERWKKLIANIRTLYSGKLTYAANWHDEYEYIDFWDDLDFIGIQAYFPLTENKNPDLEMIEKGWTKHIVKLEELHKTYEKQILFTEVGYRSDAAATIKPWEWDSAISILHTKKSDKTQQLAFEALFKQLWHKDWFAGVYIWQWDHRSTAENATKNLDFSPRFKPAENTIARWFGKAVEK